MYNFLVNSEVSGMFDKGETEITTVFLCNDEFTYDLEKWWDKKWSTKEVGGLPFKTKHASSLSDIKGADILFVSNECQYDIKKIKSQIGKQPILFFGYKMDYNVPMINFVYQDEKLKYSINHDYLAKNKISISGFMNSSTYDPITNEKEWNSTLEKLEYELSQNGSGQIKVDANDLDELLKEYREKQNKLDQIEERLMLSESELKENAEELLKKDSISKSRQLEILAQEEKLASLNESIANQSEQIGAQKDTISSQKTIITISILFVLLALGGGFIIYRSYREKKAANEALDKQKRLVELKNTEITDSINYAKRIQTAILPPPKLFKSKLPDSFVFYQPKDIVAGDFYWMQAIDDNIFFAAADCTGHGVPGAMVSVICNGALNRAVREFKLTNPGEILDKVRDIVIQEFEKSEEEMKDGMDIALCSLSFNSHAYQQASARAKEFSVAQDDARVLKFSGAQNPLWIIRNGDLLEFKGDKQPIGKFEAAKPFTSKEIKLEPGDQLYIFTDGFADQFGGENGKKYKAKNLKRLLLDHADKTMEQQLSVISETFEEWRGSLEQLDDVCVIGVRIP